MTSEIPANYFGLPAPVHFLPAPIHPSSLLYSGLDVTSTLSLLPHSLSPLKAESLLLRSDLSLSLHLFLSPSSLIFLPSTHNEWLKNVHCVSAFVCLCERTQFQRQRLTLNDQRGKQEDEVRWVDADRNKRHWRGRRSGGRNEWLQLLTFKPTAKELKT